MARGGWFRRFAEVPGVDYPGDPQRSARLPERDAKPEVHKYGLAGDETVSLSWPSPEGSTSASPVHRVAFGDIGNESSAVARERVLDALELPGEITDYHFAIQGVAQSLYKRRRVEPEVLPFVEWLAWLDARLVVAHEPLFRIAPHRDDHISTFALPFLLDLYVTEGFLHEALALAERFAPFMPSEPAELRARIERMNEEHG